MRARGRLIDFGLCALAAAASACTFGNVTDGSGAALEGARLDFYTVPMDYVWTGEPVGPSFQTYAETWTSQQAGNPKLAGWYELNAYAANNLNAGDMRILKIDDHWSRVRVSKPGFETRVFYRQNVYTTCPGGIVFLDTPYSGGPYPARFATAYKGNPQCNQQSFQIFAGTAFTKQPDLIVDPRTLLDYVVISAQFSSPLDCENAVYPCLRYSTGVANVGAGDLWVTAPATDLQTVSQRVFRGDNLSFESHVLPNAAFVYHPTHNHFHFSELTQIRLRAFTPACNTDDTATNCPIVRQNAKMSFCLADDMTFDIAYLSQGFYTVADCSQARQPENVMSQGIGAGQEDVYDTPVPGQQLDLRGLDHGDYWFEAEVNPGRVLIESDYSNNVTRVKIRI